MSTDIIHEVVRESASQLVHATVDEMVQGHMTVIRAGDWLDDFILEAITPMLPRVVGTFFILLFLASQSNLKMTCVVQEDIHTSPHGMSLEIPRVKGVGWGSQKARRF